MQIIWQNLCCGAQRLFRQKVSRAVAVISLTLCFALCGMAQSGARGLFRAESVRQVKNDATLTPAQLQADFDLMRKALEEVHSGLYRYVTKAEMDKAFDTERAKLQRPMTKPEFLVVVSSMLARIRCGHTGASPDNDTQALVAGARKFPLRVLLEGQRLMVMFNDTPDDRTIQPGMEIVEINGRKTKDIIKRIWPTLSTDGDIETGMRRSLSGGFSYHYWLVVEQASEFTIKAKDATGKSVTAKLTGDRTKNQNPVNAAMQTSMQKFRWSPENFSLRFLKEPEIAQIRIRGFGGNNYREWIENTFKSLHEKGAKTLIIDLRGNGGGVDMYGAMLVSYLTDKPFRYFDHINIKNIAPSFKEHSDWRVGREAYLRTNTTANPTGGYLATPKLHPGVAEQQPGKYPFTGRVFVLIDGGTFSTAADFCAVTHHLKRATFIGEETGGGYYGNNSGMETTLTLPNSKTRIGLPMYEYWNAVPGYSGKRRGTQPDHVVATKVSNLLRGVDEQLELALKLATPAPSK